MLQTFGTITTFLAMVLKTSVKIAQFTMYINRSYHFRYIFLQQIILVFVKTTSRNLLLYEWHRRAKLRRRWRAIFPWFVTQRNPSWSYLCKWQMLLLKGYFLTAAIIDCLRQQW